MRHSALQALSDQGLMNSRIQKSLHEDVLPWLFNRVDEYLVDYKEVVGTAFSTIEMGVRGSQFAHGKKID